jgi:hypothetical protein
MKGTWILIGLALLMLPVALGAQQAAKLSVDEMVFCTGVQDRQPMGADTAFASSIGNVYCFVKISGGADTSSVDHTWYFNGKEMTAITLPVRSASWRTWSSKKIAPEWQGTWRVDVVSSSGEVLKSREFTIKP